MSLTHPHTYTAQKIVSLINSLDPPKDEYVDEFGCCYKPIKKDAIVPYPYNEKSKALLCGIAFDYLARFLIAHKNHKYKDIVLQNLVACRLLDSSYVKRLLG